MIEMNKELLFDIMEEYEKYSIPLIKQLEGNWFASNGDIRWYSNYVHNFTDENITGYYLSEPIARVTRWDLWNDIANLFVERNIKTNLDIGCANNHFSFLCNKKDVFSVGIDPRNDCVNSCSNVFKENFGDDKYGYVGSFKTFIEFFSKYDEKMFDCITILNFLHGADHDPNEIKQLFELLPKITDRIIISEPNWAKIGINSLTKDYKKTWTISKENGGEHYMYEFGG